MLKYHSILSLSLISWAICSPVQATPAPLKTFTQGSYQQLLQQNAKQPFVLSVWSTTCSSCLKEMPMLKKLHQTHPKLKFVMLTVDDAQSTAQIQQVLLKNQLTDIEQWGFAEDNSEKLRFEIDPSWYGELPRTYFFNAAHERTAISGALPVEKFNALLDKLGR